MPQKARFKTSDASLAGPLSAVCSLHAKCAWVCLDLTLTYNMYERRRGGTVRHVRHRRLSRETLKKHKQVPSYSVTTQHQCGLQRVEKMPPPQQQSNSRSIYSCCRVPSRLRAQRAQAGNQEEGHCSCVSYVQHNSNCIFPSSTLGRECMLPTKETENTMQLLFTCCSAS